MKTIMKTFISLFISTLFSANMVAQTYYYNMTKTFYQDEYTYQCDVVQGNKEVILYNKENKLTYTDQINKDTGKELPLFGDNPDDTLEDDWTRKKSEEIVNSAFSSVQRDAVKGHSLGISMYINPVTGKVIEVRFETTSVSPFATIPVTVYRQIEIGLKNNIWFTPTADGKKLNYIYRGWNQEITVP